MSILFAFSAETGETEEAAAQEHEGGRLGNRCRRGFSFAHEVVIAASDGEVGDELGIRGQLLTSGS